MIVIAALTTFLACTTVADAGPHYGSVPQGKLSDVAADQAKCGLTKKQLTAAMMAVSYNESGTGTVSAPNTQDPPAPAALGRYDAQNANLWPFHQDNQSYHRVYWMPGDGLFQLDDAGLGSASSRAKFFASTSASVVSKYMVSKYCGGGGVRGMFGPWTPQSCGNAASVCIRYYNSIYNGEANPLNFHPVSGIKDGGGNVTHVCQYGNVDGSRHFACTFSDWTKFSPCYSTCSVDHDGNGGLTPLSYPFYDYRTTDSKGHNYEVRYWMTDDTGLSKNYRAKRPYLQNSRNNGVLRWTDSPKHLCDLTLSKGDCPTVFRCQASVC
jgi:hypothetical protein